MDVQDTGIFRKNVKDQFYTKENVARTCVQTLVSHISQPDTYTWIEPAAGNGVFLRMLPSTFKTVGIDIDPKNISVQRGDFLKWCPVMNEKRIIFGNPPFGRQSALVKKFIKHASKYADIIAFILPLSFVKPSMTKVFPLHYHCTHTADIEKNAFEVNRVEYDVPCIFQIWEKRDVKRSLTVAVGASGFRYVKPGQAFHIAFKRVGGSAGQCSMDGEFNRNYHYFITLDTRYVPYIEHIIYSINYCTFVKNTVGPKSISKGEANDFLNQILLSMDFSLLKNEAI